MGRTIEEENRQNQCIKVICAIGILSFVACLYPIFIGADEVVRTAALRRILAHTPTRVAVVAASFPLFCDFIYDFLLPRRLTYPRGLLLLAMCVPNITILLISISNEFPTKLAISLKFSSEVLFVSGLAAYIAGEVDSVRLLVALPTVVLIGAMWNLYYVTDAFLTLMLPLEIALGLTFACLVINVTLVVSITRSIKFLDPRRKAYATIYVVAVCSYSTSVVVGFNLLTILKMGEYTQDVVLLTQVVVATGVSLGSSRLARHDAITATVTSHCIHIAIVN
jgi:hypothetical protein